MITGQVSVLLAIGASQDITVTWDAPFIETYAVDVVALGLLGRANATIIDQDREGVTVRITAAALVSAGTQFIVLGVS